MSQKSRGQVAAFNGQRQGGCNYHIHGKFGMAAGLERSGPHGIYSNGYWTMMLLRAIQMDTQPDYCLIYIIKGHENRNNRKLRSACPVGMPCNIFMYIFRYKLCSLHGTMMQCYHNKHGLQTYAHNCVSLPRCFYSVSVLERQNRKEAAKPLPQNFSLKRYHHIVTKARMPCE